LDFSGLSAAILSAPVVPAGLDAATTRAKEIIKTLTLEQKVELVHGGVGPLRGQRRRGGGIARLDLAGRARRGLELHGRHRVPGTQHTLPSDSHGEALRAQV